MRKRPKNWKYMFIYCSFRSVTTNDGVAKNNICRFTNYLSLCFPVVLPAGFVLISFQLRMDVINGTSFLVSPLPKYLKYPSTKAPLIWQRHLCIFCFIFNSEMYLGPWLCCITVDRTFLTICDLYQIMLMVLYKCVYYLACSTNGWRLMLYKRLLKRSYGCK